MKAWNIYIAKKYLNKVGISSSPVVVYILKVGGAQIVSEDWPLNQLDDSDQSADHDVIKEPLMTLNILGYISKKTDTVPITYHYDDET